MNPSRTFLNRRQLLLSAAAGAGSLALPAMAQSWPNKPLRWIVPYAPGGASDIVARVLGEQLGQALGQRVVVDNRPGAGGTVATAMLASAAADGYSMCTADNGGLYNNWALFPKLPYTPESFEYVAMTGRFPLVLAVSGKLPVKTFEEFRQWVRNTPDLNYASPGVGSPHHIAMALLEDRLGVKLQHVPYKGDAAAVVDVVRGEVPFMLLGVASARQYIKEGQLRCLAVSWDSRLNVMPDVPTFDEVGVRDFAGSGEQGILMPAGTPKDIVQRINQELAKVLSTPTVREKLETVGMYPVLKSPEDFRAYVNKNAATAVELIKRKGITIS